MNLKQASTVLKSYITADVPTFLWGAPGVGKSDVVRDAAKELNCSLIDFRAVLRDPVDLRGLPSIDGDKARWLVPSDLPNVERDGPTGILFLDELNAAPPMMQAACFGLVLDRKVGDYELPAGWKIVAAGNRQSDRAAAQKMPSALANRFAHIDVEPDIDAWTAWASQKAIDPMVIGFLNFRPNQLHNMDSGDHRTFPTPRAWAQVNKVLDNPDDIRALMVKGLVGEGASAEFDGFIRAFRDLPPLASILSDPTGARLPQKSDGKFAVAYGLAGRVRNANEFDAGMTYMRRIEAEFEILYCLSATRREEALTENQTFIDWTQRHKHIVLG
jgi:MoxR-like ATPase